MKTPANPAEVKATLDALLPETLQFLEDLVRINSFTRNLQGVHDNAERIIRQFSPLGFTARKVPCSEPDTGEHLILDSGGDGPVIACISHLDTVFTEEEEVRNQFQWERMGNRIYGPGTIDIKGGTAAIWMLVKALSLMDPARFRAARWILIWNAAEEILAEDFGALCLEALPLSTRACLIFEADNQQAEGFCILRSRKGSGQFKINVSGRGAHAGSRFVDGANAIHQVARLIERVSAMTDLSRETTVNVGFVRGGGVTNRVPHEAEARLEVRAYEVGCYQSVRDQILALRGAGDVRATGDSFPCSIDVAILREVSPWPRNRETESLVSIWQEASAVCGYSLQAGERGGLSDGNRLWGHLPTLDGLGPRGGNGHASERSKDGSKEPEYVDVTSFVPKTLINYFAVLQLLTEGKKTTEE